MQSSDSKAPEDHFSDGKDNFRAPCQNGRQEEKTTSYPRGALEEGECRTTSGEGNSGQKTSEESADDHGHVTLPPGLTSRQEEERSCSKVAREEIEKFGVTRGYGAWFPGHSSGQEEKTTSYSRGAMEEDENKTNSRKRNYDKFVDRKGLHSSDKQEEEDLDISLVDLDSDGGDGFKFVIKPTSEKQGAVVESKVDEDKSRKRFKNNSDDSDSPWSD